MIIRFAYFESVQHVVVRIKELLLDSALIKKGIRVPKCGLIAMIEPSGSEIAPRTKIADSLSSKLSDSSLFSSSG